MRMVAQPFPLPFRPPLATQVANCNAHVFVCPAGYVHDASMTVGERGSDGKYIGHKCTDAMGEGQKFGDTSCSCVSEDGSERVRPKLLYGQNHRLQRSKVRDHFFTLEGPLIEQYTVEQLARFEMSCKWGGNVIVDKIRIWVCRRGVSVTVLLSLSARCPREFVL